MDITLDVTESETAEDIHKKRIEFFKSALNLYRGTRFSLEAINESMVSSVVVPEQLRTYEVLRAKLQDVHNEVTQLQCLRDITRVIHSSLALSDLTHPENEDEKKKIEETIQGITHFSRNIINMYEDKCDEIERIEKSKVYVTLLDKYQNHLERQKNLPRESDSNMSEEDLSKMEKAERKIEKINVIRAMKAILLAKYATNHDRFPDLQQLRTSNRRNLTKDDFLETWNVDFRQT